MRDESRVSLHKILSLIRLLMYSINWVNDQCRIVVKNGSDDCEWVWLASMAGKGGESEYNATYLTY